jgi:tRNA-dihydrouridine synthase B
MILGSAQSVTTNPNGFWATLPRPIIGLAPMDGVGDHPFRQIQKKYGNPAVIYTEFTSVEALCHGDGLSMLNLLYDESQRPIIAQIYGKTPHYFRQVAVLLCELGFDGIDLNMGCPARTVANKGCGAGLICAPDLAQTLIRAVQAGVQDWLNGATLADCPDIPPRFAREAAALRARLPLPYQTRRPVPVSVKTRIGFDAPVVGEWIPRLLETAPAAICLHGRTLRQAYKGVADWDAIAQAAELAQGSNTLILGNGDVQSRADGEARAARYGLDGVLIGRASFGNPFVFCPDQAKETDAKVTRRRLLEIALEHARLYEATFAQAPFGRQKRYCFMPMRKHLGWYVKEFFGARQLRSALVQTRSAAEAESLLHAHGAFSQLQDAPALPSVEEAL